MPVPPRKPAVPVSRLPNSQVAPGQRPYVAPGRTTASTHNTVPEHELSEGRLYRVRDKYYEGYECKIWGENLTFEDANKLKEKVSTRKLSKTARVEDMEDGPFATPPEGAEPEPELEAAPEPDPVPVMRMPPQRSPSPAAPARPPQAAPIARATGSTAVPRTAAPPPASAAKPTPKAPTKPMADRSLEHLRGRAVHAGQVAAEAANQRHKRMMAGKKLPPLPKPPLTLSDDVFDDLPPGEIPSDDELLAEEDLHAIAGEVGGAPTSDDVKRAKAQRDEDLARHAAESDAEVVS